MELKYEQLDDACGDAYLADLGMVRDCQVRVNGAGLEDEVSSLE